MSTADRTAATTIPSPSQVAGSRPPVSPIVIFLLALKSRIGTPNDHVIATVRRVHGGKCDVTLFGEFDVDDVELLKPMAPNQLRIRVKIIAVGVHMRTVLLQHAPNQGKRTTSTN